MIHLRNLTLRRGAKLLLAGAGAAIAPGQRVGVVGPNGCGKSSLFALFTGGLHADGGDVEVPPGWVVAHVAQEIPDTGQPAIEFVIDGDQELRAIEAELARAEADDDGERLAHLHDRYGLVDGYSARARAAALMDGLGFGPDDLARPLSEFSGGWRMRLALGRALMSRSDLLLLDEPTNHLDLDAVIWLEGWLAGYRGALLLVSHDREFLDATVGSILAFERQALRLYAGNFSAFEAERAERLGREQALYARQQREIARLERFIERFRAKATKARQAQSRIKALERMERIAPAHVDSPFTFHFREFPGSPDPVLVLEDAAAGYDGRPVLAELKLAIPAGARIGLLGRNGAGKSTLVKLLAGRLAPLAGHRREGRNLRVGYFAQHQIEELRPDDSPLAHLVRLDPQAREQELRDYLGTFDFAGDMALAPVERFSGGERARLALALIIWRRPNLLLLDEPTNHLDLDMREALTLALQEFEGAMVLVSHDRHLLRTATDALMLVADGRLQPFDGDLDDYRDWLGARRADGRRRAAGAASRRDEKRAAAAARQALAGQRKPLLARVAALERRMAALSAEKRRLEAMLASTDFYTGADQDEVGRTLREQGSVSAELETVETEWLALQAELEEIG
ncbi:MAG: ATP-binding cassette domain-containing protein [Burkholderiales bacterium]|nr:ATP-binding cassette domain-containing protein [Burkholderiales bacterium]